MDPNPSQADDQPPRDPWARPVPPATSADRPVGQATDTPVTAPLAAPAPDAVTAPAHAAQANAAVAALWSETPAPQQVPLVVPTWTLVDSFAGLGVVLLLSSVVGAVAAMTDLQLGPWVILLGVAPVWIGLLGTTIWACRRHGTGNLVTDLGLRFRWSDLLVGFLAGIALRLIVGIWATLVARLTGHLPQSNLPQTGGTGLGSGFWLAVSVFAIAIGAPVVEEIFFRGLTLLSALHGLRRRADRPRFADPDRRSKYAVLISASLFSLIHVSCGP